MVGATRQSFLLLFDYAGINLTDHAARHRLAAIINADLDNRQPEHKRAINLHFPLFGHGCHADVAGLPDLDLGIRCRPQGTRTPRPFGFVLTAMMYEAYMSTRSVPDFIGIDNQRTHILGGILIAAGHDPSQSIEHDNSNVAHVPGLEPDRIDQLVNINLRIQHIHARRYDAERDAVVEIVVLLERHQPVTYAIRTLGGHINNPAGIDVPASPALAQRDMQAKITHKKRLATIAWPVHHRHLRLGQQPLDKIVSRCHGSDVIRIQCRENVRSIYAHRLDDHRRRYHLKPLQFSH